MKLRNNLLALLSLVTATTLAATLPSYITTSNSPAPTDPSFISAALSKANSIRRAYAAPELEWSAPLAAVALNKSNGCILNHAGPYGENAYLWWTVPADTRPDFVQRVNSAFDAWVSQKERDAYRNGDLLGGGHFTQMVWKASRRMGCAFSTIQCTNNPDQEWWFYCDFDPAGNVIGDYERNVSL